MTFKRAQTMPQDALIVPSQGVIYQVSDADANTTHIVDTWVMPNDVRKQKQIIDEIYVIGDEVTLVAHEGNTQLVMQRTPDMILVQFKKDTDR